MLNLKLYFNRPRLLLLAFIKKCNFCFSDSVFLRIRYKLETGNTLHLKNPERFTEKIQWLKLHNRKEIYTRFVDKYLVKEYVSNKIGQEYIIPLLGVWDNPDEINFEKLPDKFVLKTTHGGGNGGVIICNNKKIFDTVQAQNKLHNALKSKIYPEFREWPYKHVKPRIIAETLLELDNIKDLTDYKIFCFNGSPKYIQVIQDRSTNETIDFFDVEWNHMPFYGLNPKCKNSNYSIKKPVNLEKMIDIARTLSENIPFLRVDLYNLNGRIYFGELTFFPGSGFGKFTPDQWDYKLGELIQLN